MRRPIAIENCMNRARERALGRVKDRQSFFTTANSVVSGLNERAAGRSFANHRLVYVGDDGRIRD